ncbi:MAG: DNA recombination protein RmuC, partial [Pseudomonadota bacterium]
MIQLGEISLNLSDPLILAALVFGAVLILILSLVIATNRSATRSARMAEPMIAQMNDLATRVQGLSDGQHQLT